MKIVDKYVYPKSSRASSCRDLGITRSKAKSKNYPSVTTVLGNTQPKRKTRKSRPMASNVLDFEEEANRVMHARRCHKRDSDAQVS
jgi:hypothetical protein